MLVGHRIGLTVTCTDVNPARQRVSSYDDDATSMLATASRLRVVAPPTTGPHTQHSKRV